MTRPLTLTHGEVRDAGSRAWSILLALALRYGARLSFAFNLIGLRLN